MENKESLFSKTSDGASADAAAAINFLRGVVSGVSVHSEHGRHLVLKLKEAAQEKTPACQIKNERALRRAARLYGVEEGNRNAEETAMELFNLFLNEFSEQEGFLKTLKFAPKKRQSIWEAAGIKPNGIDRTIVEAMHITTTGTDRDYLNILHHAFKTALTDGWGGSRLASICSDILSNDENFINFFSVDAIKYALGGRFRASFRPLNDAIIANRIFGIAYILGCNNLDQKADDYTNTLTLNLVKRNILVFQTGCASVENGKTKFLKPETALEQTSAGLREFCEATGIPPVLCFGNCADSSMILETAAEIVFEGGLGEELAGLPAAGIVPECMSEEAIAVGCYFAASGIDVILRNPFYVSGSQVVSNYLCNGMRDKYGASFHFIDDPEKAAINIVEIINHARDALGINKKTERKLFDMKDRRAV